MSVVVSIFKANQLFVTFSFCKNFFGQPPYILIWLDVLYFLFTGFSMLYMLNNQQKSRQYDLLNRLYYHSLAFICLK